ncbi:MAG TPA: tetratricopeptide repeat protein [Candidatus Sulfopaludibacter sp.]|nr:tetratricopeptide repeat protein [Candidatus Sulfopaludibacter sp.]
MTSSTQATNGSLGRLHDLWRRGWLKGLLLVLAVIFVYQPVWQGKPLWDDDAHLTSPGLRSSHGLARIWIEPGATQQYYPLVYSIFWVEHKLWGDTTLGYHLINILLHAFSALLLWTVLRQLQVSGAYLAAAIFALHPVCVESVAWISEIKNTLSGVFYLSAALVYLKFDRSRNGRLYFVALGLFLLGLMSKTVAATLPAALLVVFWWQRGKLSWNRDVLPLIPLFVAGMGAGLFTAWVEWTFVGASHSGYNFSFVERVLIAGRVIWFYLGKLVWPVDLIFIYPRWHVSQTVWWQYLFPIAALLVSVMLWLFSRRNRAPLAAWLFFVGTLFPALGFFNVYPFCFSFVADHFQYLAGMGPITLAAAGIVRLLRSFAGQRQLFGPVICGTLLLVLGVLSWRQSGMYTDIETLWRTTIARNPDCWLANNNLGGYLYREGHVKEAMEHYQKAIQISPDFPESQNNLGVTLAAEGRFDEAIGYYRKALQINPNWPDALNNLGMALAARGRFDDAIENYRKALQIAPNDTGVLDNLGTAFTAEGRIDEALGCFREALAIDPNLAGVYNNLGILLAKQGQVTGAIEHYQKAIELNPARTEFYNNLGNLLAAQGRSAQAVEQFQKALEVAPDDAKTHYNFANLLFGQEQWGAAIEHYQQALKQMPDSVHAHYQLGLALQCVGESQAAIQQFQQVLKLDPFHITAQNDLAWILATSPDASLRNGSKAVEVARRAVQLSAGTSPQILDTLAAAYAEAGQFPEAITTARQALDLSVAQSNKTLTGLIQNQIQLFETNAPYREKP